MTGRIIAVFIIIALAAACRRDPDAFVVPDSHPASPRAQAAAPIQTPSALEPEFQDVRPKVAEPGRSMGPAPTLSGDQTHQHRQ
ncbi:MAG: hypothetical protein ACR2PO_18215 [Methyloligellaceae bacterium]